MEEKITKQINIQRLMLFQGDLPLNMPFVNLVVHDCLAAIWKGKCCGKWYSRSCNIPLSVLFLSFAVIFYRQRREPFI